MPEFLSVGFWILPHLYEINHIVDPYGLKKSWNRN